MESLRDKPEEERHALMKAKMTELQQWAKDNNIEKQYLHGFGHGKLDKFGRHGMGHIMKANKKNIDETAK
jgi:hypothetical protein